MFTVAGPFRVAAPVAVSVEPKVAAPDALRVDRVDAPATVRVSLTLVLLKVDAPETAKVPLKLTVRAATLAVVVS